MNLRDKLFWIKCTNSIPSCQSINWYPWSIPSINILISAWLALYQRLGWHWIDTSSTIRSTNFWLMHRSCLTFGQLWTDCRSIIVNRVLTAHRSGCRSSTDWDIERGCQLTVLTKHSTAGAFITHDPMFYCSHVQPYILNDELYWTWENRRSLYLYTNQEFLKGKLSKPSLRSHLIHTEKNTY